MPCAGYKESYEKGVCEHCGFEKKLHTQTVKMYKFNLSELVRFSGELFLLYLASKHVHWSVIAVLSLLTITVEMQGRQLNETTKLLAQLTKQFMMSLIMPSKKEK